MSLTDLRSEERYREQLQSDRNRPGKPLVRRALRHSNAEIQRPTKEEERIEAWLDIVAVHTRSGELKDPETVDEAPRDIWVGPPPRREEVQRWRDLVSER
jgi:hypothetical protein